MSLHNLDLSTTAQNTSNNDITMVAPKEDFHNSHSYSEYTESLTGVPTASSLNYYVGRAQQDRRSGLTISPDAADQVKLSLQQQYYDQHNSVSSLMSALTMDDSWTTSTSNLNGSTLNNTCTVVPPTTLMEGAELHMTSNLPDPALTSSRNNAPRTRLSRSSIGATCNGDRSATPTLLLGNSNHRFQAGDSTTTGCTNIPPLTSMGGPPRRRPSNGSLPSRRSSTGSSTCTRTTFADEVNTNTFNSFGGSSTSISTIETELLDEDLSFLISSPASKTLATSSSSTNDDGSGTGTTSAGLRGSGGSHSTKFRRLSLLAPTLEETEEGESLSSTTTKDNTGTNNNNAARTDALLSSLSRHGTFSEHDDLLPPGPPPLNNGEDDNDATPNTRNRSNYLRKARDGIHRSSMNRKSLDLDSVWHSPAAAAHQPSLTLESALMGEDSYFLQMEPEDDHPSSPVGPFIEPKKSWGVTSSLTLSSTFFEDQHSYRQLVQSNNELKGFSNSITSTNQQGNNRQTSHLSKNSASGGNEHFSPSTSVLNTLRFSSHETTGDSPTTYYVGNEQKVVPSQYQQQQNSTLTPCSQPVRRSSESSSSLSSSPRIFGRQLVPPPPPGPPLAGTASCRSSPLTSKPSDNKKNTTRSTSPKLPHRKHSESASTSTSTTDIDTTAAVVAGAASSTTTLSKSPRAVLDRTESVATGCSDAPSMPTRRASLESSCSSTQVSAA